jgi:ketosteroid isomerase-like protein
MGSNADIVQRGWEAVWRGDWDALVADYTEDMRFIMPGQSDLLEGQSNFRQALEGLGDILPPGAELRLPGVTRQCRVSTLSCACWQGEHGD